MSVKRSRNRPVWKLIFFFGPGGSSLVVLFHQGLFAKILSLLDDVLKEQQEECMFT